jgi:DNA-binding HxlR family transcriptional regulator
MFGNRRHYGDLVRLSEEGIASNILANRLVRLVQSGLDPTHKQKAIYSLTEASIQLVPLLAHMGAWGCRHTSASRELSIRAQLLEKAANECGRPLWPNSEASTWERLYEVVLVRLHERLDELRCDQPDLMSQLPQGTTQETRSGTSDVPEKRGYG